MLHKTDQKVNKHKKSRITDNSEHGTFILFVIRILFRRFSNKFNDFCFKRIFSDHTQNLAPEFTVATKIKDKLEPIIY